MSSVFFYHTKFIIGRHDGPRIVLSFVVFQNIGRAEDCLIHFQSAATEGSPDPVILRTCYDHHRCDHKTGCLLQLHKPRQQENIDCAIQCHDDKNRYQIGKINTCPIRLHQHRPAKRATDKQKSQKYFRCHHRKDTGSPHRLDQISLNHPDHECNTDSIQHIIHIFQRKCIILASPQNGFSVSPSNPQYSRKNEQAPHLGQQFQKQGILLHFFIFKRNLSAFYSPYDQHDSANRDQHHADTDDPEDQNRIVAKSDDIHRPVHRAL